jgi:ubiquilin
LFGVCDDYTSMMENPQMQQMMQSVMSNPAMMEMAVNSDPRMRAMMDANPNMRQMLQNPQMLQVFAPCTAIASLSPCAQSMMNPQSLRAMSQAQQQVRCVQSFVRKLCPLFGFILCFVFIYFLILRSLDG